MLEGGRRWYVHKMATIGPKFQLPAIQFQPLPPPVFKAPGSAAQPIVAEPTEQVTIGHSVTVPFQDKTVVVEEKTVPLQEKVVPLPAAQVQALPLQMGNLQIKGNQNAGALFLEAGPAPDIQLDWAPRDPKAKSGIYGAVMGALQGSFLGGAGAAISRTFHKVGFGSKKPGPTSADPEKIQQAISSPYAQALRQAAAGLASVPKDQLQGHFNMLESALLDPKVTVLEKKHLGGGINGTYIVTLSNGAKAVFKPTAGEDQSKLRNQLEEDHQGKREEAAYLVDKAMGHLGRVPPTVRRSIDGQDGALMIFVPEAEVAMGSGKVHKTMGREDSYRRLAVLDNVIGNLDRHEGNWMVTKDGDALPIDHGLAFPWKNESQGFMNYDFQKEVPLTGDDVQGLQKLSSQREALTERLSGLLEKPAIESMFDRVDRMVSEQKTSNWWQGSNSKVGWDR